MDSIHAAELAEVDALGQAALAASGELSAVDLLDAAILRLESARQLNAVITDLFDRGRAQAKALDESGALRTGDAGPLAGVPFLLKGPRGRAGGDTRGDGLARVANPRRG